MRYAIRCLPLLALLAGCGPAQPPAAGGTKPPVPVVTAPAAAGELPLRLTAVGTTAASALVTVRPQVSATVAEVCFAEGADVAAGTVLFRLDDRTSASAVRQAEAALARDQAQAAFARAEAERLEGLGRSALASPQQVESARAMRDAAQAAAAGTEAALARARLDLAYGTITAPIAGRTGAVGITAGNLAITHQTALVTIARLQPMHVGFAIPARDLAAVRAAAAQGPLSVRVAPEGGGAASTGVLDLIENRIDSASATIRLRASCPNADLALWPGQQCRVELILGREPRAVTVPEAAVQLGQRGTQVWVVDGAGTATLKPVRVARYQDGLAVIADGLAGGETVVVDGQLKLTPGARVARPDEGGRGGGAKAAAGGR